MTEFVSSKSSIGNIALALYSGLFSYAGWNYVNFVTEELKDPQRNLPRSIWIALPLVTVIYVSVNIAYLVVLSPGEIASTDAVAVLFGKRALGPLQYAIPVFVALSTFGSLNGTLFTSGRLFMAGARQGHLPQLLAFINIQHHTPVPAILVSCFLSLFMLGFEIVWLINCLSFALWLTVAASVASLIWLRRVRPNIYRSVRVPLYLVIFFETVCIFLVIVPVITEPHSAGMGLLFTLTAIPIYVMFVTPKPRRNFLTKSFGKIESILQRTLLIARPESTCAEFLLYTEE